jgi:4-amino-4-deoxy-L-arabinose transferase-like glycosyltransferase
MILLFALAKFVVHLVTASGYGYFRDEFYYLACAEHPAAGYVDQPPLSVFVIGAVHHLLGDSRIAIRLVPAILGAVTVALVGLITKALGGGRWAAALAMTAAFIAPGYLAVDHFYSMNAFDVVFWALAAYLVIRLIDADRTASLRLWILLGVVLGLGLLNKISVLWLGAGLFVGMLASPQRRWLLTPGPWIAGAIAGVLFAPHVIWQMQNGWPTLEFLRHATSDKMIAVAPLDFFLGQMVTMHPFTLPLWLGGLVFLFVHPAGARYRLLGWMYVTVFLILMLNGASRSGYLAPAYTWLFAAGGVAIEKVLGHRRRLAWLQPALIVVLLIGGALIAPLAIPVLPVNTFIRYATAIGVAPSAEERHELGPLPQFYADMHGWDAIVATVAGVYRRLPADDRAAARILAPDYGIAGAIDVLGRSQGLPPAISGHNNYWLWGPRDWDGRVLIVIGGDETRLRARFEQVDRVATLMCGYCMPYENDRPVWIARRLRGSVEAFWTAVKHYD